MGNYGHEANSQIVVNAVGARYGLQLTHQF